MEEWRWNEAEWRGWSLQIQRLAELAAGFLLIVLGGAEVGGSYNVSFLYAVDVHVNLRKGEVTGETHVDVFHMEVIN